MSATSSGSTNPTSSETTLPTLTLISETTRSSSPEATDGRISGLLTARLNRLHQHWEDAAKLLERKRKKMEALHLKIDRIEKKIKRRQAQIFNYEFLVKDYYPQVIEDVKRLALQEEEEEDISENEQ